MPPTHLSKNSITCLSQQLEFGTRQLPALQAGEDVWNWQKGGRFQNIVAPTKWTTWGENVGRWYAETKENNRFTRYARKWFICNKLDSSRLERNLTIEWLPQPDVNFFRFLYPLLPHYADRQTVKNELLWAPASGTYRKQFFKCHYFENFRPFFF